MRRVIGISIAAGVPLIVAMGLLFAHTDLHVSVGIAVIATLIGNAIARPRRGASFNIQK